MLKSFKCSLFGYFGTFIIFATEKFIRLTNAWFYYKIWENDTLLNYIFNNICPKIPVVQ